MTIVQDPNHPSGVATTPGDKGGSALTKARMRKALSAVDLKVRGYRLEVIAEALGYPDARACGTAMEVALAGELRETDKSMLRAVMGRRLEQAWRSLDDKIKNPDHPDHLAAVMAGVKVVDRYAKLMGLDAPTEFIVTNPSAQELQDWVENAVAMASGPQAGLAEADILEGEYTEVDDDPEED